MRDRLFPFKRDDGRYSVAWETWTDIFGWDEGRTLGDFNSDELERMQAEVYNAPLDPGEHDWALSNLVPLELGISRAEDGLFVWRRRRDAQATIHVINEVLKLRKKNDHPSWSILARQTGWTSPIGWKP